MTGPRLMVFFALSSLFLSIDGASAETRISLYLGTARTRAGDVSISQPSTASSATFGGVTWKDASFEAPPYYGLRVDHFLPSQPNWGVGLEFNHYKVYADADRAVPVAGTWLGAPVNAVAPLSERVQNFSISHGVNFVGVSALYRGMLDRSERFPQGRLQPYVGAGPVYYILHPENTINNLANNEKYQESGLGLQLLGGLHYGLTPRAGIFVELKFTGGKAKVDTAGAGRAETNLNTYHGALGMSWRF